MNTGELFLAVFFGILVIAAITGVAVVWMNRPRLGPTRREEQLEELVYNIRERALENRDVEPQLSYAIEDMIKGFNKKMKGRKELT